MIRLGHGSSRAAPICRHGDQEREREIADAIDGMIVRALRRRSRPNGHVAGAED
jgi:hypothetical protein